MFIGAINSSVRRFLANAARCLDGRRVVVGCSGNFSLETVVSKYAQPIAVHSNDVSLYSCAAGWYLAGGDPGLSLIDNEKFGWLSPYLEPPERALAAIMVLMDALQFEKQNNPHRVRMWQVYRDAFPQLVNETVGKIQSVARLIKIDDFYAGDVFDHFRRFDGDNRAAFCCFAPTYAGGYERIYKSLDGIFRWNKPAFETLNDARRDALLHWMQDRDYLWYDDREIPGMAPVMVQRGGLRSRQVYLYSNLLDRSAYLVNYVTPAPRRWLLAGKDFELTADAKIEFVRIKSTELAAFKECFLSKHILFGSGDVSFAVVADEHVIGFLEYGRGKYGERDCLYLQADFCVAGSKYKRLSKLIVMLAISGQARAVLERVFVARKRRVFTTAFTDRPVSMKYRGVMTLAKRGRTASGEKFLNYAAEFNDLSFSETLASWTMKQLAS